jgi:MinD-like ATPase involved in chromosome partitioning or flagellar assembly
LAASAPHQRNFLILLGEPHAWVAAATLTRYSPATVSALVAPVPGIAFLSAQGRAGSELDDWWHRTATAPGRPVVIAAHEDGLPRWIPGLDADFVVAVPDDEALTTYRHLPNVTATVDDDPRQLAELALRILGPPAPPPALAETRQPQPHVVPAARQAPAPPTPVAPQPPMPAAPQPSATPAPPAPAQPPPAPPPPARTPSPPPVPRPDLTPPAVERAPRPPAEAAPAPPAERAQPARAPFADPFELLTHAEPIEPDGPPRGGSHMARALAQETAALSRRSVLGEQHARIAQPQPETRLRPGLPRPNLDPRQILDRLGQGRRAPVGAELGQAVLACKPVVAAVVSRKGGVGKTASAAAIAAILGEAVDPFGHTAALVDANVGNPDAWGRLDIQGQPPTMRDLVRSLMSGLEPPSPAFAETPALAIYPESREAGDGYAPAQIQRVAAYLKARHAAVVVDLPNRLPAFTSAEAAVAAAWVGEADVLVLPTTADPTALLGAIEYLDADSVQGKPVVVSYIVPRVRQIRDAPQVRGMLDRIRASVAALVEIPDDDRATLALIQRVAITEVGGELRQAYVGLATRVVEAAASRSGGAWS